MDAVPLEILARINEILTKNFTDANPFQLAVTEDMQSIPLVAANVVNHSRSFSQGQKVHIYDGYWGTNERVLIVARYRRKRSYIFGVAPIKNLNNFRPEYVYHPAVLNKFRESGKRIDSGIFSRFFDLPYGLPAHDYRHCLLTGKVIPQPRRIESDATSSSIPTPLLGLRWLLAWLRSL